MDLNLPISTTEPYNPSLRLKERAMSVGELVAILLKQDQSAGVGSGDGWVVGVEIDYGFPDSTRVKENMVNLVRSV